MKTKTLLHTATLNCQNILTLLAVYEAIITLLFYLSDRTRLITFLQKPIHCSTNICTI